MSLKFFAVVPALLLAGTAVADRIELSGDRAWPSTISLKVKPLEERMAELAFEDSTGQMFRIHFGVPKGEVQTCRSGIFGTEWHYIYGGANDGILHFPIRAIHRFFMEEGGAIEIEPLPEEIRPSLVVGDAGKSDLVIPISDFTSGDRFMGGPRQFYDLSCGQLVSNQLLTIDFSLRKAHDLHSEIPIYGFPRGFRLTVEAPAEAAGCEFTFVLYSVAFTREGLCPPQRLREARPGEKTIRQTFEISAPFADGWTEARSGAKPRARFPGFTPTVTRFYVRQGAAKPVRFPLRLVSLEAVVRPGVNRPPLMATLPKGERPPETLEVGFMNLDAAARENASIRVVARDWNGKTLGEAVRSLPKTAPGAKTFVRVPLPKADAKLAFAEYTCTLEENGRPDPVIRGDVVSWSRPPKGKGSPVKRPDLVWGIGAALQANMPTYGYHSPYVSNDSEDSLQLSERYAELAQGMGAKWDRIEIQAFRVTDGKGKWDFSFYDRLFDIADRHGITCLGDFGTWMPGWTKMTSPEGQDKYIEMVHRTVARYKGRIRHWEIWNEPNGICFWNGTRAQFVDFSNRIYDAIKAEDPTAEAVALSTALVDLDFIDKCKAEGLKFDSFSVHPYRDKPDPESVFHDFSAVTNRANGAKLWATEFGWSTAAGMSGSSSERRQAANLARMYMAGAATGAARALFAYRLIDTGYNKVEIENNYGVVSRDLVPKPAYRALANVFRIFTEGTPTLDKSVHDGRAVWTFRMGGKCAVWAEEDVTLNFRFDEKARAINLMGESLGSGTELKLTVGPEKVVFLDRLPQGGKPTVYAVYRPVTLKESIAHKEEFRALSGFLDSGKAEDRAIEDELAKAAGIDRLVEEKDVPKDCVRVKVGGPDFEARLRSAKATGKDIVLDTWNDWRRGGCVLPDFRLSSLNLIAVWRVLGRQRDFMPACSMGPFWLGLDCPKGRLLKLAVPDFENEKYGPHPRQGFNLWLPKGPKPADGFPLLLVIHGGGWNSGDRDSVVGEGDGYQSNAQGTLATCRRRGVAMASMSYRMEQDANDAGIWPPLRAPLEDAVLAVRCLKANAARFGIDPGRILVTGGSAGAVSSQYVGFVDDCALGLKGLFLQIPQTSLDPKEMKEWIPNIATYHHAFKLKTFDEYLAKRTELMPWIEKFSPAALVRRCTPAKAPRIVYSGNPPPKPGDPLPKDASHSGTFCVKLQEICDGRGIPCRSGTLDDALDMIVSKER